MQLTPSGIVLAILFVSLLIMIHEGGHFLMARWCGMRVLRFSLGFGRPVLQWERKAVTLPDRDDPARGFVQIAGMNPQEELDPAGSGHLPQTPGCGSAGSRSFAGPFSTTSRPCLLRVPTS